MKKEKVIAAAILFGIASVLITIIFFFWQDYHLTTSQKVDSEKFAQFGDFIGGFIGSIWTLVGVFLFYKALTEQRADFKNNKDALELQVNALNQQIGSVSKVC